jgi:hypothetical protein
MALQHGPGPGRLHFFWPLLGPALRVPNGWTCRRVLGRDGVVVQTSRVEDDLGGLILADFVSQARYRRVERGDRALRAAMLAAEQALPGLIELPVAGGAPGWALWNAADDAGEPVEGGGAGDGDQAVHGDEAGDGLAGEESSPADFLTVAHLVVAVSAEPALEDAARAFEEGVDLVHTTHRALYAQFLDALQLPTPESAETLSIVTALEVVEDGRLAPTWPLGLYLTHSHGVRFEPMTEDDLARLGAAEAREAMHHPVMLLVDLRRQAFAAARRTGDTRTAVVMAATACETYVDVCLGSLLWEEGATPEEGAAEMSRYRETFPRLQSLLAPRLGGSWDPLVVPELREWRDIVAGGRNRVVHAGGLPSPGLADRACEAMLGLVRLIVDRLCTPKARTRFPMTALMLANRPALEARGGWTRRMRSAETDFDRLDLWGVFARWYNAVDELRLPPDGRRAPDASVVVVHAVALTSGQVYWLERDERAGLARLVEPSVDVAGHEAAARRALEGSSVDGMTLSFDETPPVTPLSEWLQEHRLVPGVAVLREPALWYDPPDAPDDGRRS